MVPVYYQLTAYNPSDFLLRGGFAVLDSIITKLLKKNKGDGEDLPLNLFEISWEIANI